VTITDRPRRLHKPARPVRHIALTTAMVLAVCAAIGGTSAMTYHETTSTLHALTARATGTIIGATGGSATVTWPGHPNLTVPLTGNVPTTGTHTEIAYNPATPTEAIIPGATILTEADQSQDGILFAMLVAALVALIDLWHLTTRWQATRRPAHELTIRRISMRRGLMARTWLETDDNQWIPVHFEPAVLTLPAPTAVRAHGKRLVAIEVPGATLYPSGRTRRTEPPGRRTDSPTEPDAYTATRATTAARWRQQLRVDSALLVPTPLVGVLWAYLDNGGLTGWLGATAITSAAALWWAATRGSDPS